MLRYPTPLPAQPGAGTPTEQLEENNLSPASPLGKVLLAHPDPKPPSLHPTTNDKSIGRGSITPKHTPCRLHFPSDAQSPKAVVWVMDPGLIAYTRGRGERAEPMSAAISHGS